MGFASVAAIAAVLVAAAFDEDAGFARWQHLRGELADAHERIEALRDEVGKLEREAVLLESDSFALERAIREELELVRPGQQLIRLGGGAPSGWNP